MECEFDPKLILGGIVAIADALKISHDDTTFSPGVKERLQKAQTMQLVDHVSDYARIHGIYVTRLNILESEEVK